MKLFNETESKYYELISYLLVQKKDFSGKDVDRLYAELSQGEKDYEVIESLFSTKEGEGTMFSFSNGNYSPILNCDFPIRCNRIEQQAFGTLDKLKYADRFISEDTLTKIRNQREHLTTDWRPDDIVVKNQYSNYSDSLFHDSDQDADLKLQIISEAIMQNRSIIYDNVKNNIYEYRDETAFLLASLTVS